jgi:DNA ligase-1
MRVRAAPLPSPRIAAASWPELASAREESRARQVEGLVLKRLASAYGAGRRRGDWSSAEADTLQSLAAMLPALPPDEPPSPQRLLPFGD